MVIGVVSILLYISISDQSASVLSPVMENIPSFKESGAAATPAPSKSSAKLPPSEDHISVQAQGRKVKTEAANPYLQYLSERKRQFRSLNPNGAVNVKAVNVDWKNLSDEERNVYKEKFRIEKEQLGDAYRHGRKRKSKEINERKLKKNNNESLVQVSRRDDEISVGVETKHDEVQTIEDLLNKLEGLDEKIEESLKENDELKRELSFASTELAIKKYILVSKTESHDAFETKYNDLLEKHKTCYSK